METFLLMDDFIDAQKIIYELDRPNQPDYPYDEPDLYYQEGVPTKQTDTPFVRLLQGKEPVVNMQRRFDLYETNWAKQQELIDEVLLESDRERLVSLKKFLYDPAPSTFSIADDSEWRVPTALMNLGSNIANHARLLNQVYDFLSKDGELVVRLNTAVCNNIRSAIKLISYGLVSALGRDNNQSTGSDSDNSDKDAPLIFTSKVYRNLPDLEELIDQVGPDQTVSVLIEDADSLPTTTLTQLLKTLWHASIKYKNVRLVVGISTPLMIFQEKIPRLLLNILRTKSFQVDNSDEAISTIMEHLLLNINDTYNSLVFEPRLVLYFLKLKSQIGISQFYDYMKLIYLNHYYSQPLSILWTDNFSGIELTDDYFDAFKRLQSIRSREVTEEIADLYDGILANDTGKIASHLRLNLNRLINWRYNLKNLIDFLNYMQESFYDLKIWKNNLQLFALIFDKYDYDNVYNTVDNFDFLKPILLNMANVDLDSVNRFIDTVESNEQFEFLLGDEPLQHVNSAKEAESFTHSLNDKLTRQLRELNLDDQPFKEICCVGLEVKDLLKNAFNPSVREVTTDALLSSRSYLNNSVHSKPMDAEPMEPTSILMYRLYREAGVVINIYDFYRAFQNSLTNRDAICRSLLTKLAHGTKEQKSNRADIQDIIEDESSEAWDKLTLSWFLKGLVELEMLGLIKQGRNSECIEKLVWKGI